MSKDIEKDTHPGQVVADSGSKPTRRGFLFGAGAAAGVAGAAALALKTRGPAVADVAAAEVAEAPAKMRGYHETAHIRRYYETTKV